MIRRIAIAIAVVLAACAAIVGGGCGGGGSTSDELASVAPANVPVYLESVVRPEGQQRDAVDSLASRVGGIQDPGATITSRLDAGLSQMGGDITYENDIAPWLGQRAAIFFMSLSGGQPDFAVAFQTTDSGAASDFLNKVSQASPESQQGSYNGVDYFQQGNYAAGIVDDFLVFGSLDAFKAAVDASNGSSLADSSGFQDGTSAISQENLGFGYVNSSKAIAAISSTMSSLQAQAARPLLAALGSGPAAFSVSATTDEASIDLSLPSGGALPQLAGGDLLGKAPADAWFAIGVQDLGRALKRALDSAASSVPGAQALESEIQRQSGVDLRESLSWMRDGYAFVSGTSRKTIDVGAVVQSTDTNASSADISALRKKVQADADAKLAPPTLKGADQGFSAQAPESPQAVEVDQVGDQVVAALGPGQPAANALHPSQALADDPSFKSGQDALGSGFSPLAFVSLSPFFVVAEKGGSGSDPGYLAAKPYLQKLDYLLAGSSSSGDRSTIRFVIGVK